MDMHIFHSDGCILNDKDVTKCGQFNQPFACLDNLAQVQHFACFAEHNFKAFDKLLTELHTAWISMYSTEYK